MSSFVGMREHDIWADFVHQIRNVENQLEQLHARLSIYVSEIPASVRSYPHVRQCVHNFAAARARVLLACLKSSALCVSHIARRPVGHMCYDCIGKPGQKSTGADCLVVRVRNDHESSRQVLGESHTS